MSEKEFIKKYLNDLSSLIIPDDEILEKLTKIKEVLLNTSKNNGKVMIFGNGVHYYAFERYSMTHSYEFFMVTLLIYLHHIFYKTIDLNKQNLFAFILPFIYLLTLLVRYTNYFIFLMPFWLTKMSLLHKSKNRLRKNSYFLIGTLTSLISYYFI